MVSTNITSILSTLITANHILHYHSVLDAYGHVSVRNPENASTFFISRTLAPALLSSAEELIEHNVADGSPTDPSRPRSFVERFVHSEILKRFDSVNCVVHSHSPQVLPYTTTDVPLKAVYHMAGFLGNQVVPIFDIAQFYGPDDRQDILVTNTKLGAALASQFNVSATTNSTSWLPDPPILLMRGHGFVAAAESIEQAVFFAMYTQSNAEVQSNAVGLESAFSDRDKGGRVRYLTAQEGRDAWTSNKPLIARPWELWHREVQTMGRGLYVNELEQ
jgi:ribulose-5-phosphate 4-epimerase/fuculose-1-phosphate aldolase